MLTFVQRRVHLQLRGGFKMADEAALWFPAAITTCRYTCWANPLRPAAACRISGPQVAAANVRSSERRRREEATGNGYEQSSSASCARLSLAAEISAVGDGGGGGGLAPPSSITRPRPPSVLRVLVLFPPRSRPLLSGDALLQTTSCFARRQDKHVPE